MTYRPRRRCRRCERDRDACGGVSRSGLCRDCGPVVAAEALEQISAKSGPYFDAWLGGYTDMVARLWGDRLARQEVADLVAEDLPQEAQRWLVG